MFFASPGSKQACPKLAACWSPSIPAIGTPANSPRRRPSPRTSEDERICGSIDIGMPRSAQIAGSHCNVRRSISKVREALVTSVAWTPPSVPPVSFHSSQLSIVPINRWPFRAACRAPGTFSNSHVTLGPAK